jgi:hypothetical protein
MFEVDAGRRRHIGKDDPGGLARKQRAGDNQKQNQGKCRGPDYCEVQIDHPLRFVA